MTGPADAAQRPMSGSSPAAVTPPLIDPQDALQRAGGRPELAHELFRMLCDSLEDSAARLRQALAAGDRACLHDTAHRLHGACLYCGVPRLREAAIACIRRDGFGAGASRLVCGNLDAHVRLEEKLAALKKTEACAVFSTGYMANVGIIASFCGRNDIILADKLNHASIIDGILLSGARFRRYPHGDTAALESLLKDADPYRRRLIVTDSVFSMDGDRAPLKEITALARRYGAAVMVDEAHAFGVLGENGKGLVEELGLEEEVDIQMGTLSKAVGAFGAYCCGPRELIDLLVNRARSLIYTTGMPPSTAAAALKGIEIIENEPQRRRRLLEHTDYLREELRAAGFDTLNSRTPIIPVVVKEADTAVEFSRRLFAEGLFVQAIRPPTVPRRTARLRVTVMATHTEEDLNLLLDEMRDVGKELKVI